MYNRKSIVIVMGVSGSGKSTIGSLLAQKLDFTFMDADDYHPPENVEKMASGRPLNDDDRQGWLEKLNDLMKNSAASGLVLACSALKEAYRRVLIQQIEKDVTWIYLEGSYEEIMNRMTQREEHFMPSVLLKSQFDTLEVPDYAIPIQISSNPEEAVTEILGHIK